MDKAIKKLENCLKAMKKCLKVPRVENCICFSDAFKVLDAEVNRLHKNVDRISYLKSKEKLASIKEEIERIKNNISQGNKECIGCSPCIASVVFKAYPDVLNSLYMNNNL
jgi:archaellum component FlaC